MIKLNDYRNKILLHLLNERGSGDMEGVSDVIEKHGGYPDGMGNILFDSEQQETWFVLKWS